MRNPAVALIAALVLLGAGAAVGACHRRQAPAPAAAPPTAASQPALPAGVTKVENRACDILTQEDAESVLGGPVKPPITHVEYGTAGKVKSRCGYVTVAGPPAKVITLLVMENRNAEDTRSEYEHAHAMSQTVSGQVPENVPALGDRAYWSGGTVCQLNVLSGNRWLVISGTSSSTSDPRAPAEAAATRILKHP
jgi:hypothetical protein